MTIAPSSLASAVGSSLKNVAFQTTPQELARKAALIATYDPAKLTVVDEVPVLITSAADAGDKFGFGFPLHRLALAFEKGSFGGIEAWAVPQSEAGGAVVAAGEIDWATSVPTVAGVLSLWIATERIPVTITVGMSVEEISDAVVAAVNAVEDTPVVAAKTAVSFETTFTAKGKGTEGNTIDISLNLGVGESTPAGVAAAITPMASGAGIPDIQDALDGLGTDDSANEAFFTEVVHAYGQDTTTLDAVLGYVGATDLDAGLYGKTVARPFRSLVADVATGSAGLAALLAVGNLRRTDRSQGILAVPGSLSMPVDISAQALGHMARIANIRSAEAYNEIPLTGIHAGAFADRWTSNYTNRDTAVKGGISPTLVRTGVVTLQNVITFSRPAATPVASNAFREMANVATIQNMLNSQYLTFSQEKWQNVIIVADAAKVTNTTAKQKARGVSSVFDQLVELVNGWEAIAWIADASFTINRLVSDPSLVTIRGAGDGFDIIIPVVLSGVGNIIDSRIEADISFAVLS